MNTSDAILDERKNNSPQSDQDSREAYLKSLLRLPHEKYMEAIKDLSYDEHMQLMEIQVQEIDADFREYQDNQLDLDEFTSGIEYRSNEWLKKDREYWICIRYMIKKNNPGIRLNDLEVLQAMIARIDQELDNRRISCDLTAEASLLMEAGRYQSALEKCREALEYAYTNPWAHYYIMLCSNKVRTVSEVKVTKQPALDFLHEMQEMIGDGQEIRALEASIRSHFYQEHFQYSESLYKIRANNHIFAETGGTDNRQSYLYKQVKKKNPKAIEDFKKKISDYQKKAAKIPEFGISFGIVCVIMIALAALTVFGCMEAASPETGILGNVQVEDILNFVPYWGILMVIAVQMLFNHISLKLTVALFLVMALGGAGIIGSGITDMIPVEYIFLLTKVMLVISILILVLRIPSFGAGKRSQKAQHEMEVFEKTVIYPLEEEVLNELDEKIRAKADRSMMREYFEDGVRDCIAKGNG